MKQKEGIKNGRQGTCWQQMKHSCAYVISKDSYIFYEIDKFLLCSYITKNEGNNVANKSETTYNKNVSTSTSNLNMN